MTVQQAITVLETVKRKHGGEVLVYFDCPHCQEAFTPSTLTTAAVHISVEKK